jgi:hypothetical protein
MKMHKRRFDADALPGVDRLVSALSTARDSTSDQARELYRNATDTLTDGSRTARKRVHHAVDALAGRPAPVRWGLMAVFAAAGLVIGAVGALSARMAVSRRLAELDVPDEITAAEQALAAEQARAEAMLR